jgi:heme/copper-type cytochrome/quinol oxidase subunit 4
MNNQSHSHSRARLYVISFLVLGVLTMIEFAASTLPSPVKLPTLLTLASIKGLMVAGIYMHLRFDKRVFATLVLLGLGIGMLMVLAFTIVLSINWST